VLLVAFGWMRRWMAEDAFIYLRVVRNVLDGHGPVFNLGQRVEVFTSPIWIALLSGLGALLPHSWRAAGGLEWLCVVLDLACAGVGLLAATAASIRLQRGEGRAGLFLPVGSLAIALFPPFWDFATSGLESALAFAWLGGAFWLLVASLPRPHLPGRFRELGVGAREEIAREASSRGEAEGSLSQTWDSQRDPSSALPPRDDGMRGAVISSQALALFLGLGPLVRPELALFSGCWFLAWVAWQPAPRLSAGLRLGATAAALPVAYQLFRMGYYAAWVSNTAIAKEASAAYWSQGWRYAANCFLPYHLEIPAGLALMGLAVVALRRARAHDAAGAALRFETWVGALLSALFVVRVGGDFMHARMFLPALFALAMPLAAMDGRWGLRLAAPLALWMLVTGTRALDLPLYQGWVTDERRSSRGWAQRDHPVTLSDYGLVAPFPALEQRDAVIDAQRASTYGGPYKRFESAQDVKSLLALAQSGLTVYAPTPLGPDLHRSLLPGIEATVIAPRFNIGMVGYAVGPEVAVVDVTGGVGDPITARLRLAGRDRPGHEKIAVQAWVRARYLAPPEVDGEPAEGHSTAAARRAYGCGDVAELIAAIGEPLTLERFSRNVQVAGRLTKLRIDPDPIVAEGELCVRSERSSSNR
jgi:arabinofuranosyltransferase